MGNPQDNLILYLLTVSRSVIKTDPSTLNPRRMFIFNFKANKTKTYTGVYYLCFTNEDQNRTQLPSCLLDQILYSAINHCMQGGY